jgi:TRAP-type C4-dicarboxylate transport system permease large subunit
MEELTMVLLTIPLFFPIVVQLGFDPVWFGVLIVMVIQIGLISPPVGMNLFVLVGISRHEVNLAQASAGALPFWLLLLLGVLLLTLVPGLATWLPSLSYGS